MALTKLNNTIYNIYRAMNSTGSAKKKLILRYGLYTVTINMNMIHKIISYTTILIKRVFSDVSSNP